MALLNMRVHGAVVTNDGCLPCEPTVSIAVIVLLMAHDQMGNNVGRFTVHSY